MATIVIKADRVVVACEKAILVAKEELLRLKVSWEGFRNEFDKTLSCDYYFHLESVKTRERVAWLEGMRSTAKAAGDGVVTISNEEVAKIGEEL